VRRLAADRAHWELLDLTTEVLDKAEQVIHATGMRTLDAVHLASALTIQATSGPGQPTKLITGDARQRDAGIGLGLQVTWVG
jgi:predicted nucleic acid-binding protein